MSDLAQEVEALKAEVKELRNEIERLRDPPELFFPMAPFARKHDGITEEESKANGVEYEILLRVSSSLISWVKHVTHCPCFQNDIKCKTFPELERRPPCFMIGIRRALLVSRPGETVSFPGQFMNEKDFVVMKHLLLLSGWKLNWDISSTFADCITRHNIYITPISSECTYPYPSSFAPVPRNGFVV